MSVPPSSSACTMDDQLPVVRLVGVCDVSSAAVPSPSKGRLCACVRSTHWGTRMTCFLFSLFQFSQFIAGKAEYSRHHWRMLPVPVQVMEVCERFTESVAMKERFLNEEARIVEKRLGLTWNDIRTEQESQSESLQAVNEFLRCERSHSENRLRAYRVAPSLILIFATHSVNVSPHRRRTLRATRCSLLFVQPLHAF